MRAPYLMCDKCKYPLKRLAFPIDLRGKWTEKCPKCKSDEHNGIVIGTEWDQMRAEMSEDTVLFIVPDKEKE